MPCKDPGDGIDNTRHYQEKLDKVTSVACEALRFLEDDGRLADLSPELRRWWRQHKVVDRRRRVASQEIARDKILRRKALATSCPLRRSERSTWASSPRRRTRMRSPILREVPQKDIEAHMGLVIMTIRQRCSRYAHDLVEYNDLLGWGTLGLIAALQRFDPSKGFRFSTYAVWYIRGYILSGIRSTYSEIWKAKERGEDTVAYRLPARLSAKGTTYKEDIDVQHNRMTAARIVRKAWPHLTKKQKEIWRLHLLEDLSLAEIARRKGVTRQDIHQTWAYSIRKIRARFVRKAA